MRTDPASESLTEIPDGKRQLDREEKGQNAQRGDERAAGVSVPRAVYGRSGDGSGPQAQRGPNGKLASAYHDGLVYRTR